MLAAELVRPGLIELRERAQPEPADGEVVIRLDAALTCGTDLKTYQRGHPKFPTPTPLGHELAGTIVASRAPHLREGDAIACVPTAPCGICRFCLRGRENLCPAAVGRMLLGAFAEYVRIPAHIASVNVFPRPASLSAAESAALEPLSCVVHGASRIRVAEAESIVLVGDGAIALLFVALLCARGARRVLCLGRHDQRLAVARQLGALTLDSRDQRQAEEFVYEWTGENGADIVIECVGQPDVWEWGFRLVAPGGELLAFGGCAAGTSATFDTYPLHYDEIDVKAAFHYQRADVQEALQLLSDRTVDVRPLITHERHLVQLQEAFDLALRREAIKVAVVL